MCELLQQELEQSIRNHPQRPVIKAVVSVSGDEFPPFDPKDDEVVVEKQGKAPKKPIQKAQAKPSFFTRICSCFLSTSSSNSSSVPRHHPGAFVGGSYFCCQANSKSSIGCQKGPPKHHFGTYWTKDGWSCCKKANRNEPGCTDGQHPKPFK
jgi:hypothetical protein